MCQSAFELVSPCEEDENMAAVHGDHPAGIQAKRLTLYFQTSALSNSNFECRDLVDSGITCLNTFRRCCNNTVDVL